MNLASEALPIENVEHLFVERVKKYRELLLNRADLRTIHFYLCELLNRTRSNIPPKRANFQDFKRGPGFGIYDNVLLTTEIMSFERFMLPKSIDCVEDYIRSSEKE